MRISFPYPVPHKLTTNQPFNNLSLTYNYKSYCVKHKRYLKVLLYLKVCAAKRNAFGHGSAIKLTFYRKIQSG